jgi:hypothetical protein
MEIKHALGVVLKEGEDIAQISDDTMDELLTAAEAARNAGG